MQKEVHCEMYCSNIDAANRHWRCSNNWYQKHHSVITASSKLKQHNFARKKPIIHNCQGY